MKCVYRRRGKDWAIFMVSPQRCPIASANCLFTWYLIVCYPVDSCHAFKAWQSIYSFIHRKIQLLPTRVNIIPLSFPILTLNQGSLVDIVQWPQYVFQSLRYDFKNHTMMGLGPDNTGFALVLHVPEDGSEQTPIHYIILLSSFHVRGEDMTLYSPCSTPASSCNYPA